MGDNSTLFAVEHLEGNGYFDLQKVNIQSLLLHY